MSKRKKKFLEIYRKSYYTFFFLLTIGVLYVFFPKQGTFKYEYQKGKPWSHETYIAPFDFPVLKTDDQVKNEKDSILRTYIPYFNIDNEVAREQIKLLENDIDAAFKALDETVNSAKQLSLKLYLKKIYRDAYRNGILKNSIDSYDILKGKDELRIVEDNVATIKPISKILSLKTAYVQVNENITNTAKKDPVLLKIQGKLDVNKFLEPNLFYDEAVSNVRRSELLENLSLTRGVIQSGERIILKGDVVNDDTFLVLESLRNAYERKRGYGGWFSQTMIGQLILIMILMSMLVIYLQNFNPKIFRKKRNFSLILTIIMVTYVIARGVYESESLSLYLIPFCILPIIVRTFLGARMAIFIHLITMFLVGFLAPNSFEFIMIQMVAGSVAVISLSKLNRRGHLIITALFIIVVYALMFIGFSLVKEGDIKAIEWLEMRWFLGNGVLILMAYLIIYIFEKIFGFVSDVTLLELSDTNHPLLRKLAEHAPGTFQHSMQVANLAEEAIIQIGGNPMLVRTGALYHDVGKIARSVFFVENQAGENPHDKLDNRESAKVVIDHVTDGVKLARKHKIPEIIIDFIKMHHGKSMAKYFYLKFKEANPDKEVKESDFMYPGPNPNTKETAVVMLADGIEAASRSLPEKNETTLTKLIDQIIDAKINNHELDNAPVTFKDIKKIKNIFLEKLKNIYHLRIEYPKEAEKNEKSDH